MKKTFLMACSAMLLLAACNNTETKENKADSTSTTTTTDVKTEEAWVPVDSATEMNAMIAYGTPGEMHKMLASWSGTWNGETTIWKTEGGVPQKSTGTAVNSMLFDGKYQNSTHKGNMMGMPFEGHSITGYDNATKKFVSTWIDNWSTGIMTMTGDWNAAAKTMTFNGTYPDICRPGKMCSMRQVITVVDDNTQKMEMFGPDSKTGKEYKMMEVNMTRKK